MIVERGQILVVSRAVLERDVEIAGLFPERKILCAVEREGEDSRLVAKDRGGSIALMHVAVDDGGAADRAVAQQHRGRDRYVVEDAVRLAAIAKRVMCAAGQVSR